MAGYLTQCEDENKDSRGEERNLATNAVKTWVRDTATIFLKLIAGILHFTYSNIWTKNQTGDVRNRWVQAEYKKNEGNILGNLKINMFRGAEKHD